MNISSICGRSVREIDRIDSYELQIVDTDNADYYLKKFMGESYLYEDLTYKIIGVSYIVYNQLCFGHREKVLQRAHEIEYKKIGLNFKKECRVDILYDSKIIAQYYMDFVIEDKVVVELKLANDFYTKDVKQILSYLKANNLKLGLLIIFNKDGVNVKRIIN